MTLEQYVKKIGSLDVKAMREASDRWDSIGKPLGSLGKLESETVRIAGIMQTPAIDISKRCVAVFCADNGVVAQGVTQTDSSVTATVAENLTVGATSVCKMAQIAHADIVPIDIGIERKMNAPGLINRKVRFGTADMTKGPAMSREEAENAIVAGIETVRDLKERGYQIIATGEMGIGNTTTSSAIASVLLNQQVEKVTGRGAGLDSAGLNRKINAIKKSIELNEPDPSDALDVLSKVGGLDIAGMAGTFLGGAVYRVPIVIDGFISAVSALIACNICPQCKDFMFASHISAEPAGKMMLDALHFSPLITADMCLGEGTGAVSLFPLFDMGIAVYQEMGTFSESRIETYTHFED